MKLFQTQKSQLLKKALDVYSRQHNAIAKNVAHVNTPDFKRLATDFSAELRQAESKGRVRTTHAAHISQPLFEQRTESRTETEENQVDLTREMAELAENQIRFDFSARILRRHFDGLSNAIAGRTR